ncbi:MAG: tyrosine-type recombinase/integrase [Hyphomicrobium sp.]
MAGTRIEKRLSAVRVKALKVPGKYEDGGGLRLIVTDGGAKRWVARVSLYGRRIERGLGSYPNISLESARDAAAGIRKAASGGIDLRRQEKQKAVAATRFRDMFKITLAQREKQLSNAKHLKQWTSTMDAYVFPKIGDIPVASITTGQVIDVLSPIWFDKPETAKRVLQRMELVFKSAIVRGIRTTASPCIGVAAELGTKHRTVRHHASMPWAKVPSFFVMLHARPESVTELSLEFLILTAGRSGETRGALWTEIDRAGATWTIPAQRMKAREAHRVPLSVRCLDILAKTKKLCPDSELIFPSKVGKPLSDMTFTKFLRDQKIDATAHGFRSSFKVWASESAKAANEVSEAALAHSPGSKVLAAYLRTDFFDERRLLMEAWAKYCLGQTVTATSGSSRINDRIGSAAVT